jgi:tol-pal system protein YbgF
MRRQSFLLAGLCAAALSAATPAFAQNRVDQQMFLDLRAVQEQTQQLKLVLNTLLEQVKAVTARLDAEATARSKGFADQQSMISGINSALSTLQENVRDNKVQVQKFSQELDAIKKGVDILTTLVTQALAQVPSTPADPNAPAGPPAAATTPAGGVPPSSADYFLPAMSDYGAGQHDMAIKGFEEVIRRFPNSPDAPRAQFYIGESYFFLGKFTDAVAAYDRVIKNYPTADLVPDAYYKQGAAYERLNQREKAIANYKLLQKDFPGSSGELLAAQALKRLNVK